VSCPDYTGERIDFFDDNDSEDESTALKVLEKYQAGKVVNVSYDPEHPESAVLEPGIPGNQATFGWIALGLGGFLTLLGLFSTASNSYQLANASR
jgi:hypothetical protein